MVATIYGAEKDVYLAGTQQLYAIGQKLETPDGSIFRFSEKGTGAGVANKLQQSSVPVGNWTNVDLATALTLGDAQISFEDGGTAFVVDEAAGGTVQIEEVGDLGHIYRIKSNAATATTTTVMQFENGVTALKTVTANAATFIKNPWKDFVIKPASAQTSGIIGVPRVIIAADGFGWVQSRGIVSCLWDGSAASTVGFAVRASEADAGALALFDADEADDANVGHIGYATKTTVPTTEFGTFFLVLE